LQCYEIINGKNKLRNVKAFNLIMMELM